MAFAEVLGERAQSRSAANVAPRREVNTPSEQPTAPSSPAPQQDRATAPTDSGAVASNDSAPSASEAATSTSKPIEAATDAVDDRYTTPSADNAALAEQAAEAGAVAASASASSTNQAVVLHDQAASTGSVARAAAPQLAGQHPITLSADPLTAQPNALAAGAWVDAETASSPLTLAHNLPQAWQSAGLQPQPLHAARALTSSHTGASAAPLDASPLLAAGDALFANTINAAHANAPIAGQPSKPPVASDVLAALTTATDANGTAAARSLQEFNAMMEAARATSSTTLAGQATSTPSITPGFADHGLGLMPMNFSVGTSALASGVAAGSQIAAPLTSPQWPTEMGRQFISMAKAATGAGQVAELRLDPPELGPLRITINLNDNVAQAVFSSPHALVRQTVENALPQLQQMLEEAGISLGQADVNDQESSGQMPQAEQANAQANGSGGTSIGSDAAGDAGQAGLSRSRPSDPNALVDVFA